MSRLWLVKSEPDAYSWADLVRDGGTVWSGVRNFQARNHLRAMRLGDRVLFYHSVTDKQIVGLATVTREAFPDPTAKEGDWSAVELKPVRPFVEPVALSQIKADPALRDLPLLKQSRLSVLPVAPTEFKRLLHLGQTKA